MSREILDAIIKYEQQRSYAYSQLYTGLSYFEVAYFRELISETKAALAKLWYLRRAEKSAAIYMRAPKGAGLTDAALRKRRSRVKKQLN